MCLQIVAFCPFENFRSSDQCIFLLTDVVKHCTMINLFRLHSTTRWPSVGMVTNNHFRSCQATEICIDLTIAHYLKSSFSLDLKFCTTTAENSNVTQKPDRLRRFSNGRVVILHFTVSDKLDFPACTQNYLGHALRGWLLYQLVTNRNRLSLFMFPLNSASPKSMHRTISYPPFGDRCHPS